MTEQLLQARAERGHPRGAIAVWDDAERQLTGSRHARSADRSATPFRLAVAAAALLLAGTAAALLGRTPESSNPPFVADPANTGEADANEVGPDEPARILIDGMTLDAVSAPVDLRQYCEDAPQGDVDPDTGAPRSNECRERSFAVFADPDRPFAGTIVVLETLPNGDFELFGFNLGETPEDEFGDAVVRAEIGGDILWTLDRSVGLDEMARFDDSANVQIQAGWMFDYVGNGPERVALLTEPDVDDASVWRWIARSAAGHDDDPKVATPVDVLGTAGVQLDFVDRDEAEIVWASGNRTYRLLADNPVADDYDPIPATPFIERLRIVDRATWLDAIDDATNQSIGERIAESYELVGLLALAVVGTFFLQRRRWVLAAAAGAGPVIWLLLGLASGGQ